MNMVHAIKCRVSLKCVNSNQICSYREIKQENVVWNFLEIAKKINALDLRESLQEICWWSELFTPI